MAKMVKTIYYVTYDKHTNVLSGDTVITIIDNIDVIFKLTASIPQVSYLAQTSAFPDQLEFSIIFNDNTFETGSYTVYGKAQGDGQNLPFTIELTVIDSSAGGYVPQPPDSNISYELKYWLEYFDDTKNPATYKLELLEAGFEGTPTEIHGYVNHNYQERKDLMQPIVASSLDITLEANTDLSLQDLYSEDERKFLAKFYRNGQIIFHGFLKPDGIWEDWVNDRWELSSLDAMDGLSILKNLSFVQQNGSHFFGKMSQFEVVYYCLKRIGFELPINLSQDIPIFTGYFGDHLFTSVLVNTARFYQDENKNNIMDCEAVLKSVLDLYNATIIQMNGEWWIFRAIDVKSDMVFRKYVGLYYDQEITVSTTQNIGSHINGFSVHHISANQKKSMMPSIQAFRVNYKYGTVKSIMANSELKMGAGLTAEGWTFYSNGGKVTRNPDGYGIGIDDIENALIMETNQDIEVNIDDAIDVSILLQNTMPATLLNQKISVAITTDNYIMSENGWVSKASNPNAKLKTIISLADNDINVTHHLPPALETSNINIKLYADRIYQSTVPGKVQVKALDVSPNSSANYKGEFHTAQRLTRISSVTKADKTVYNGDSNSDIYVGTLYKSDGNQTTTWNRKNVDEQKSILQIMVEDMLMIAPRPMIYFEGDTFGYFPYLSFIAINNISGKFQISKYSFDTKNNINRTAFKEFETQMLDGYRYEFDYDFGNETRVTIKS